MDKILIEARPSGPIKTGKINRALNIIEGTTLIGPLSTNGANHKRRYSEAALKKIASMAEGLPGYLNHVKPEDAFKPRDVRDLAVRHQNVRYDPTTQTVKSDMHVLEPHAPLVFSLAERFGDRIGSSLISKGAVTMEGDTEVVQDILAVRSADLVSDPASTKGLFEGVGRGDHQLTILDLIESLKTSHRRGDNMLPDGIHARVAAMFLTESTDRSAPRSDLKSDSVANTPRRSEFAPDLDIAVRNAVQNYLKSPLPAPKPKPVVTLTESYEDLSKRISDPTLRAYALLLGRA
jgi:hypothetical protein